MSEAAENIRELDENNVKLDSPAYMNRLFCSTKERVAYMVKSAIGGMTLGRYDVGSDFYINKLCGVKPTDVAKANVGLGIYDIVNDPLSAAIIDNMRSRWGKFKPFQFLSILPSFLIGFFQCIFPLLILNNGYDGSKKI